jgi:hypothetical protein
MSAATESTLQELLQIAAANNANMAKLTSLISQLGPKLGTANSGLGSSAAGLIAAFNPLSLVVKGITGTFNILSNLLGSLGNIIGSTVGSFQKFFEMTLTGTMKFSDLSKIIGDLVTSVPVFGSILGSVAGVFTNLIQYSEQLLVVYRNISNVGAGFSGNIYEMAKVAASAYISLDQFQSVVIKNSAAFAALGTDVDSGARKFADISAKLIGPGSKYAQSILGLGYSTEQAADMMGLYITMQGNLNRRAFENNDKVAGSVANMIYEIDALAKITGISRKEAEDALKKTAMDDQFKLFLQNLDTATVDKLMMTTTYLEKFVEQGAADMFKQAAMSGGQFLTPTTKAMQDLYVQTRGSIIPAIGTLYRAAMDTSTAHRKQLELTLDTSKNLAENYTNFITKDLGVVSAAMISMGDSLAINQKLSTTQLMFSNKNIQQVLAEILKKQEDSSDSAAAQLAQVERMFANIGNQLRLMFLPVINDVTTKLLSLGNGLTSVIQKFVGSEGFTTVISKVTTWFTTLFNDLSNAKGFEGVVTVLKERATQLITDMWSVIKPGLEVIWADIKPGLFKLFQEIVDMVKEYLFGPKLMLNDASQDKENIKIMNPLQLMQSSLARAAENIMRLGAMVGLYNEDYVNRISASRINRETEALMPQYAISGGVERKTGTLGVTGSYFENFGSGTPAVLHGTEAVVTPSQMNDIINRTAQAAAASSNKDMSSLTTKVNELSQLTSQMLYYLKQTAENTRKNVQATRSIGGDILAF